MSPSESLAVRLRQSIQGCTLHMYGPVQAWASIEDARVQGIVRTEDVAKHAVDACTKRISELRAEGVDPGDPRIRKEELTRAFIEKILR